MNPPRCNAPDCEWCRGTINPNVTRPARKVPAGAATVVARPAPRKVAAWIAGPVDAIADWDADAGHVTGADLDAFHARAITAA